MNNLILPSASGATMSSREIAELTRKEHFNVLADVRKMFTDLELDELGFQGIYFDSMNRKQVEYLLNRELTDCLLTGYSAKMRMAVIKRWHELELNGKPSLPVTYIEALQALIESEKQKELAIATKAEIGHRREATAMNTASQAVKRANKLEIELDQSQQWSTVKRMEIITGLKFNWRLLKSAGADLGIDAKDVFDPNFGTVKAYHADVWREAYALDIKQ